MTRQLHRAARRHFVTSLTGSMLLASGRLEAQDNVRPIVIALVGDSTMASYPKPSDRLALTGWGQVFSEFFTDRVSVRNHAASGRSSKSFLREGRWEPVLREKPDYVFIQFGHNDQPGKGDRSTDPATDFRDNLRKYIGDARQADAIPVLVTPVARRIFQDGKPHTTLTPWAEAMQAVGAETNVPVIDLHAASLRLYGERGDAGSRDMSPSDSDRTHFSRNGAVAIATLVVEQLPDRLPALTPLLKPIPQP